MIPAAFAAIRTFWRMPCSDRRLVIEATVFLAAAALAIAVLPFRHVGLLAGRPTRRQLLLDQERTLAVRRVRRAIVVCARWVPWRALCFQQGLAAQWMLRRRGASSVLYYGAAPDDQKGLVAHVWVRDGDVDVIGCEIAYRFVVLATFP